MLSWIIIFCYISVWKCESFNSNSVEFLYKGKYLLRSQIRVSFCASSQVHTKNIYLSFDAQNLFSSVLCLDLFGFKIYQISYNGNLLNLLLEDIFMSEIEKNISLVLLKEKSFKKTSRNILSQCNAVKKLSLLSPVKKKFSRVP